MLVKVICFNIYHHCPIILCVFVSFHLKPEHGVVGLIACFIVDTWEILVLSSTPLSAGTSESDRESHSTEYGIVHEMKQLKMIKEVKMETQCI